MEFFLTAIRFNEFTTLKVFLIKPQIKILAELCSFERNRRIKVLRYLFFLERSLICRSFQTTINCVGILVEEKSTPTSSRDNNLYRSAEIGANSISFIIVIPYAFYVIICRIFALFIPDECTTLRCFIFVRYNRGV